MSRYLIRRIEEKPAIVLRTRREIVALEGDGRLERVRWRDERTGDIETHDIRHVFMMTGAAPNTRWLDGCIALDEKGFVKTGPDLSPEELAAAGWPLHAAAVSARNEPTRHLRGRRRARRQHQARGVGRRRRVDRRRVCSSGASTVKGCHARSELCPHHCHCQRQARQNDGSARSASRSAAPGFICAPARSAVARIAATTRPTVTRRSTRARRGIR